MLKPRSMLRFVRFTTKMPKVQSRNVTYTKSGDVWQLPSLEKVRIGSRTMIMSENNELSRESSRRMAFELQSKGIEPVFCSMNTSYPTDKNIEDSADLLRRTGSKSIIAIGSGALQDTGKAVRFMAETGTKKVTDFTKPALQFREHIPLLCVATTISPLCNLSACGVLHPEDDVLVKTACWQPEVIVYDAETVTKSGYFVPETSACYLLSQLLDCLFAICLDITSRNQEISPQLLKHTAILLSEALIERATPTPSDIGTKYVVGHSSEDRSLTTVLGKAADIVKKIENGSMKEANIANIFDGSGWLISHKGDNGSVKIVNGAKELRSEESTRTLMEIADKIGALRSLIQNSSHTLHCTKWPGIIEAGSQLVTLNVENEWTLPYAWVSAATFKNLLTTLFADATKSVYKRETDRQIMSALHTSLSALTALTGLTQEEMIHLCNESRIHTAEIIRKSPKKYKRVIPGKDKLAATTENSGGGSGGAAYQFISPAGQLEKLIAIDEMQNDSNSRSNSDNHAGDSHPVNIHEQVAPGVGSLRTAMLKSDVMLDFVEKIMT